MNVRPTMLTRRRPVDQLDLFTPPLPAARSSSEPALQRPPRVIIPPAPDPVHSAQIIDAPPTPVHPRIDRALDEARLRAGLATQLDRSVALTITENRRQMISVRRLRAGYDVRAHAMFLDVDARMLKMLASYIKRGDRQSSRAISDFIELHRHRITAESRPLRPCELKTEGEVHDIGALFAQINAEYFDGRVDSRITWGTQEPRNRRYRTVKLGSYWEDERLIRIHPALDRAFVPRFFVASVVHHEMLHQVVKATGNGRRRCVHGPEFRMLERDFVDYEKAVAWERANIRRLLTF